jgi:L-lactate permease
MKKPWLYVVAVTVWLIVVVVSLLNFTEQILLNGFWRGFFYTLGTIGPVVVFAITIYLTSPNHQEQHG